MKDIKGMEGLTAMYGLGFAFWAEVMFRGPMLAFAMFTVDNPALYFRRVVPTRENREDEGRKAEVKLP